MAYQAALAGGRVAGAGLCTAHRRQRFRRGRGGAGLPIFVKPACEGSSIGISKVKRRGDLAAAYAEAAKYDPLVVAEQGILGGEYTVGIIEQAGPPCPADHQDRTGNGVLRLRSEVQPRMTRSTVAPGLPAEREAQIQKQALEAFRVLGGRGWGGSIS